MTAIDYQTPFHHQQGERQTEDYQTRPLCGTPKAISDGRGKCGK